MNYYNDYFNYDTVEYLDYFNRQQPGEFIAPPSAGGQSGPTPMGPPPGFSPPIPAWQQGPGGLNGCLFRNTYIWLRNGNSFWFFPTFVGRNTIIGFQWRGIGWIYNVINPNSVVSFQCF
ncbi:hypothetical protein ACFYKX_09740 [Cytobacillus sp. FJAT-54145]|uniref:Transporter n=1 Tax=Cytobacillus spartinae TaxID=3299023 RepID=A0ABW6KBF4_9BACI